MQAKQTTRTQAKKDDATGKKWPYLLQKVISSDPDAPSARRNVRF
jgi:hypothetical protein